MTDFQQRLHNLRIEHGYSLETLANELNRRFNASFNKGMLSKYESGKTIPDFKNIPYLAEVFGVSVDYLIGVSDNPSRYKVDAPQDKPDNNEPQYSSEEVEKAMELYAQFKDSMPQIQAAIEALLKK